MKCKEITAKIDAHEIPSSFFGRLSFWFHIGICGACKNYLRFSESLGKAFRAYLSVSISSDKVEQLVQSLLAKFAKK